MTNKTRLEASAADFSQLDFEYHAEMNRNLFVLIP
jgi:hypothetical protein